MTLRLSTLVAAGFMLAWAAPAVAQRAAGPFAEVLGSTGSVDARQTLDVRGSVYGAWDDILSRSADPIDDRFLQSGLAAGLGGSLRHVRRSQNLQWRSSAHSSMRLYGSDSDSIAAAFSANTNAAITAGSRVSFQLSAGFSYSPYHAFAAGPDETTALGPYNGGFGVATAAERNIASDVAVTMDVRLSQRDTLSAGVSAGRNDFLDQDGSDLTSYGGRASWRHALTRNLGFHAGFGRDQVNYELADTDAASDTIDVGLDYGDTLTFSRRTALSFGFSTVATRWSGETHYRVNGSAGLTRAFGRSGSGTLQYGRSTEFRAGFREPLLTDSVGGSFSDQLGRRSSWSTEAGYTRGTIGFDPEADHFNTVFAGGRLTTALTRHLGIFGDYSYYRYEVPAGATVFTSLPKFSRQSISVGLSLWAPIINDMRSPRDTR